MSFKSSPNKISSPSSPGSKPKSFLAVEAYLTLWQSMDWLKTETVRRSFIETTAEKAICCEADYRLFSFQKD